MLKHTLFSAALDLPPEVRADLADQLLASLEDPATESIDTLWAAEAESRIDAYDRGDIETVSAEEVFAELRSRRG